MASDGVAKPDSSPVPPSWAANRFKQTKGDRSITLCNLDLSTRDLDITPSAVHLRKIYIHLRQQLKLYGKYTLISTSMNFINANELSLTVLA